MPAAAQGLTAPKLGEILQRSFGVAPAAVTAALRTQAEAAARGETAPPRLGAILLHQGALSPEKLAAALAQQFGCESLARVPDDISPFFVASLAWPN